MPIKSTNQPIPDQQALLTTRDSGKGTCNQTFFHFLSEIRWRDGGGYLGWRFFFRNEIKNCGLNKKNCGGDFFKMRKKNLKKAPTFQQKKKKIRYTVWWWYVGRGSNFRQFFFLLIWFHVPTTISGRQ